MKAKSGKMRQICRIFLFIMALSWVLPAKNVTFAKNVNPEKACFENPLKGFVSIKECGRAAMIAL